MFRWLLRLGESQTNTHTHRLDPDCIPRKKHQDSFFSFSDVFMILEDFSESVTEDTISSRCRGKWRIKNKHTLHSNIISHQTPGRRHSLKNSWGLKLLDTVRREMLKVTRRSNQEPFKAESLSFIWTFQTETAGLWFSQWFCFSLL